jgi:pimeloyl-ACP methyl ester carboxylesterase
VVVFRAGASGRFVSGTPWSSYVWRTTIEALSDERSVFVWDMIGYGQSDKPEGDVSLGSQGELLAALVAHWGLGFPDVVAHDYGGTVCLRAHLLHGMPMSSLALVDVVALRPWGSLFFRLVSEHADVFAGLPSNLHEALLREYISGTSGPGLRPDVLDRLAAPWLGDGQAAFYRQIAQAEEQFTADIEPYFGDIDVPTLIVRLRRFNCTYSGRLRRPYRGWDGDGNSRLAVTSEWSLIGFTLCRTSWSYVTDRAFRVVLLVRM